MCIQTLADDFATVDDLAALRRIVREKPTEGFWRFSTAPWQKLTGEPGRPSDRKIFSNCRVAGRDEWFTC